MTPPLLKSVVVPWDLSNLEMVAALKVPPDELPRSTLVKLVRELDRRHMQLQDKVGFERTYRLVDYNRLKGKK